MGGATTLCCGRIEGYGAEHAAAVDGDKVLWENVSGAAEQLKAAPTIDLPGLTLPGVEQQQPKKAKAA